MKNYENRSIFFIGDSITANGAHIKYLRSYFSKTGRCVYLHNKGVPGYSMRFVKLLIEEELASYTPDYAVISFGVNDILTSLYDCNKIQTEELLAQREERKKMYESSLEALIKYLKNRGIEPIICSPFCVNENLVEKEDIKTVEDNKEKTQQGNDFYKKATFKNINEALKDLSARAYAFAKLHNVEFWDLYSYTHAHTSNGCFSEDGVHYTDMGYKIIAECMLWNMYQEKLVEYPANEYINKIAALEFDERAYYFVKYNIMLEKFDKLNDEGLVLALKEHLATIGYTKGLTNERAEGFFRYIVDHTQKQKELIELIRKTC